MSQETQDNTLESQEMTESAETTQVEATQVAEPEAQERGIPVAALQEERQRAARLESELHELRTSLLRSANASPQHDPIEAALSRMAKGQDPDVFKVLAPSLRPLLEELHGLRQATAQQQEAINYFAVRDREREAHSQLSTLIPDLPQIGNELLRYVQKLPGDVQKMYADNPQLFIPLAEAVRGQKGGGARAVQAARAATAMDTSVSPGARGTTADPVESMRPGSPEFEAYAAAFWGTR